jgi:ABC-type nitrate/sulfonate/bicarbonate transport system substrate-binding protein
MNRLARTVAAVALATALALASGCGESDSDTGAGADAKALKKVTYLTSFGNFGRDAYAWVAKDKGFFEEAGFDVEIKPGQGTGGVIPAVVSGQAQFGPIDLTGGLLQMGSGQAKDFVAVAAIHQRTMAAIAATEGHRGQTARRHARLCRAQPLPDVRPTGRSGRRQGDLGQRRCTDPDGHACQRLGGRHRPVRGG